jgi:hypothetical protein
MPALRSLGSRRAIFLTLFVRQNAVTHAGSINTQNQQVFIRLDGAFDDLQKIRDTPIVSGRRTLKLSISPMCSGAMKTLLPSWSVTTAPAMMLHVVMNCL